MIVITTCSIPLNVTLSPTLYTPYAFNLYPLTVINNLNNLNINNLNINNLNINNLNINNLNINNLNIINFNNSILYTINKTKFLVLL